MRARRHNHSLACDTLAARMSRHSSESGQTLIFIMIVLVVLVFVVLAIYDTHHIITQRIRAQNGADAAALTGAKWQGETLNMIGELNLLKVATVIFMEVPPGLPGNAGAQQTINSLTGMQRRLAFVGPMLGLLQAEEAAKLNKIRSRPDLSESLRRRATQLRRLADIGLVGIVVQSGYPGWAYDYADMLDAVADAGMAAEFVNSMFADGWVEFSNPIAEGYLGREAFYHAIAVRDWCFLKELLLEHNYTDYTFWGSANVHLPPLEGSEYLNLGITFRSNNWLIGSTGFGRTITDDQITELRSALEAMAEERGIELNPNWPRFTTTDWPAFNQPPPPIWPFVRVRPLNLTWAVYRASIWRKFGQGADAPPPEDVLVANIRPEFDYDGADAAARVAIEPNITLSLRPRSKIERFEPPPRTDWLPPGSDYAVSRDLEELKQLSKQEVVVSTAAAKPFGKISFDGRNYRPDAFRVVLPVFETVRLIPMVYSSGGNGFDDGSWNEHRFFHLPVYLQWGPDYLHFPCYYCRQLRRWENFDFRQEGIEWLMTHECPPPPEVPAPPPGGGGGGGGQIPQPRPGGVKIAH